MRWWIAGPLEALRGLPRDALPTRLRGPLGRRSAVREWAQLEALGTLPWLEVARWSAKVAPGALPEPQRAFVALLLSPLFRGLGTYWLKYPLADQANLPAILVDGPVLADLELFTFVGPTGATRGLDHIDPPESALQSDGATRPDRVLPEPVVDEGATRPDRALHVRQVLRLRRVRHVLRQYVQAPEGARLRAALEYLGLQGVDLYDLQVAACEFDRVLRRSRIFVRPRPRARWLARRLARRRS